VSDRFQSFRAIRSVLDAVAAQRDSIEHFTSVQCGAKKRINHQGHEGIRNGFYLV
jgi:hypothetical protein